MELNWIVRSLLWVDNKIGNYALSKSCNMIKQCSLKEIYLCIRFCWIGPRSCLDDCQKPKYDNVNLIRNLWTRSAWPNFGSFTTQVSPEIPQASFTSNRPLWRNLNSLDNCDNYYHTFIVWICQMKKSVLKYFLLYQ